MIEQNAMPKMLTAFSLSCMAVFAGAATVSADSSLPDILSREVIQDAHAAISPAVCLVSYTSETTNTVSGEKTRRSRNTLGVLVSADGLLMAHGHMLLDNRKPLNIKVTVGEGDEQEEYEATLLNKPDDVNICFLRIESEEDVTFPYVKFSEGAALELGDPVFILGVLGDSFDNAQVIQTRRVGAVLKEPRVTYALDQPVTFGYIGGPVMDAGGSVVGVVGFDLSSNEGGDLYTRSGHPLIFQGDLFSGHIAVPPTEEVLDANQEHAWLGVYTQPLTDDLAEYWGLPNEGGVVVSTVLEGSPAQVAGLESGDVIVNFDGTPITATLDRDVFAFTKLVRESPMGEDLYLKLYREGEILEYSLALTTRPKSSRDADEYKDDIFGLTVRELTRDVRILLNLSEDVEGVIVRGIKSGSTANLAGIRPSYIIMRFGAYRITNLGDFEAAVNAVAVEKPEEITVFCRVGATTAFFRMQPRWENFGR